MLELTHRGIHFGTYIVITSKPMYDTSMGTNGQRYRTHDTVVLSLTRVHSIAYEVCY